MRFVGAPAVALAAVVVLGAGCSSTPPEPAKSGVRVTCRAAGVSNVQAVRRVLVARAERLTTGRVTATVSGSTVAVTIAKTTVTRVRRLCVSGTLEFRPLIAPPVATQTAGVAGALSQLGFAVPTSEADYDRLTASRRTRLLRAIGRYQCEPVAAVDRPVVTCGDVLGTGQPYAALLAAPVVTGDQVTVAVATAPGGNRPAWTVTLRLDQAARQAWTAYTTAHHSTDASTPATACGTAAPCADWVGFVFHGRLLSLPLTESAITSAATSVAGNFTEASARRLAAALQAGQIPGRLTLVAVTPV